MTAVPYHQGEFPPIDLDWPRLLPLIGPANAAIARYEGVLLGVPNPDVLLSPLTSQEAVLSSRIEGTQATLGEVLEFEAEGVPEGETTAKLADIREVLNYRAALREAVALLGTLRLSQRLIKRTHEVLMQGVRGRNKAPGEYRRIPNWMGPAGSPVEAACFVPCGADHLPQAMDSWEAYPHAPAPDLLVQLAIVRDKDWTGWCAFFLGALTTQAQANQQKARAILELYRSRKDWIAEVTRSQYAVRALDWMFATPIFKSSDFVAHAGIPSPTAKRHPSPNARTGFASGDSLRQRATGGLVRVPRAAEYS